MRTINLIPMIASCVLSLSQNTCPPLESNCSHKTLSLSVTTSIDYPCWRKIDDIWRCSRYSYDNTCRDYEEVDVTKCKYCPQANDICKSNYTKFGATDNTAPNCWRRTSNPGVWDCYSDYLCDNAQGWYDASRCTFIG